MRTDWDRRYLALAEHVATWSKDPSTKVGAILVGRNRHQIAMGYNGIPRGIADSEDRLKDRATKLRFTQHAERNVLDQVTFDTLGSTLIVTHFPCSECAKSIISKGIARVLYRSDNTSFNDRWLDELRWSREMMIEAGIELMELENE